MPDWLPPFINLGFAIFFGGWVLWGVTAVFQAYWPVHRKRMESESKKTEAEAALADTIGDTQRSIVETQRQLLNLQERSYDTMGQHGEVLRALTRDTKEVKGYVRDIHRRLSDPEKSFDPSQEEAGK